MFLLNDKVLKHLSIKLITHLINDSFSRAFLNSSKSELGTHNQEHGIRKAWHRNVSTYVFLSCIYNLWRTGTLHSNIGSALNWSASKHVSLNRFYTWRHTRNSRSSIDNAWGRRAFDDDLLDFDVLILNSCILLSHTCIVLWLTWNSLKWHFNLITFII